MNSNKKFLPIGSVIMLNGASKKLMITGYLASVDGDEVYDYSGCLYPEGFLSSKQVCLFNHEQISKLFFSGYVDDEGKKFNDDLRKIVLKKEEENKSVETLEEI